MLLLIPAAWITLYIACYLLDRIPFTQRFWAWFSSRTENSPFFRGTDVELRLAGIALVVASAGATVGLIGTFGDTVVGPESFELPGAPAIIAGTVWEVIGVWGFYTAAAGALLGIYGIICIHLKSLGLRKAP